MAGTQVIQHRKPLRIEGTNQYEITAICEVAGGLPDTGIFLLDINQVFDPKNDTLVRVADVGDFSEYKISRQQAIDAGESRWRSSSFTVRYDSIETANEAWKVLSSRVNNLVRRYDDFSAEFETITTGDVTIYPTIDPSTVQKLKDAYQSTLDPVGEAENARDDHIRECTQKEKDLESIEERLQQARADLEKAVEVQTSLGAINPILGNVQSTIAAANNTIRAVNNSSDADDSFKTSIEGEVRIIEAQLIVFSGENANLTSLYGGAVAALVSSLQARVTDLTSQKNQLLSQLNKCNIQTAKLEAAVDAAREARDAALADVLEVCPDFEA
jgi:DNA repair exonuclease SbcCD ATPase subunit